MALADLQPDPLDEARSKQLHETVGISVTRERIVANGREAEAAARELGGEMVLKVLSARIPHKSEVGGAALRQRPDAIGGFLERMRDDAS